MGFMNTGETPMLSMHQQSRATVHGVMGVCLIAGLLAGCSGSGSSSPASPPAPTSATLTIAKTGSGTGAITSHPAGVDCGATCTLTVSSGTVVTLTAAPGANNTLAGWGGVCPAGQPTCPITVTTNQTVTATFAPSTAHPGVAVTMAGTGNGTVSCNGKACSATYPWGTSVTFAATPGASNVFAGWSGGRCSGTTDCTVVLWDDFALTATFNPVPVTTQLTVTKSGTGSGTVTSSPAGINCGTTCTGTMAGGASVTLTAAPTVGSVFQGWSGGGCSGTGTCVVTLNANTEVTATFTTATPTVSFTLTTPGNGTGAVTCNGGTCNASYPSGTALTLVATPAATSLFSAWGEACASTGPASTCTLTLTANTAVSATFTLPTLSVVLAGAGSVTSSPAGIDCGATCSASFAKGTVITLTASGANFSGWSGGCSGTSTCTVTLNANTSVTATFGSRGSNSSRYYFFRQFNGALMAVDPASPAATPATVAAVVSNSTPIYRMTWNAATASRQIAQHVYQVYASGGQLWRVKADKTGGVGIPGSSTNPPVQVSSETGATVVCQLISVDDTTSPDTRRLFYELPGADNQCGGLQLGTTTDNIVKSVLLSDSPATAPTVVGTGLSVQYGKQAQVYNLTTGIATHLLLNNNAANTNVLSILNLATQAITPIQANVGNSILTVAQDTSDRIFLQRYDTSLTTPLYVYTVSSNQLTLLASGHLFLVRSADGTNLYVAEASTGVVSRVPLSATSAADLSTVLNVGAPISNLTISDNRIYVEVPVGDDQMKVLSVPKTGGASRVDLPVAVGRLHLLGPDTSPYHYTRTVLSTTVPQTVVSVNTVVLNENGTTIVSFPNEAIVGFVGNDSFGLRDHLYGSPRKLVLATYVNGVLNGGTVKAVDPGTGAVLTTVGAIPATTPNIDSLIVAGLLGDAALGFGYGLFNPSPTLTNSVFFMDVSVANSLVRVPAPSGYWFEAL